MRLGLTFPFEDHDLQSAAHLLIRAEELGYEEAWSYERNVFDAFSPLAAAATVTSRLRLGTSIVPVFTRPPGLLAMSVAALAELAPGRVILGLGSSTRTVVTDWMGLEFARPADRLKHTTEVLRTLLSGGKAGAMRLHRPPAQPIPIYLAAIGEQMARLAGEIADGIVFFMAGPSGIPAILADSGRQLDSVARVILVAGADHDANLRFAQEFIASYAMIPPYARFLARQGFAEEVEEVRSRWQDGGRKAAAGAVSEAMRSALMLVGTDPGLVQRVRAFADSGLGTLDLWFMSSASDWETRRRDVKEAVSQYAPALLSR